MRQRNNKKLDECSSECADSGDACVAFNYKEPQLVCELFENEFTTLTLTPGCTNYVVSLHHCRVEITGNGFLHSLYPHSRAVISIPIYKVTVT